MSQVAITRSQIGTGKGVDTTVKSCNVSIKEIAPLWDMVMSHKNGTCTDVEYTIRYLHILEKCSDATWDNLARHVVNKKLNLQCYCRNGKFCHTLILAQYLSVRAPHIFENETDSRRILIEEVVDLIDLRATEAFIADYERTT